MSNYIYLGVISLIFIVSGCNSSSTALPADTKDAFYYNQQIAKTINFGSALEAPVEGDWGMVIEEEFFELSKKAGFNAVRLPIKWSAHALLTAPYTIDAGFFNRIDELVSQAKANNLNIIVDFHHYTEMESDPTNHLERWLSLWQQISQHYESEPDSVFFELLNEPRDQLNDYWAEYLKLGLAEIRKTNPDRIVIVGSKFSNAIGDLENLDLPENDKNLIATFHYYEPFEFTHQGAPWVDPVLPIGTSWSENSANLASGWENRSWSTNLSFRDEHIEVDYTEGWAGLFLYYGNFLNDYTQISFTTNQSLELSILCVSDQEKAYRITTADVRTEYKIDLSECGADSNGIDRITIQNFSPDPQYGLVLEDIKLTGNNTELPLVTSAAKATSDSLARAAQWSAENNRPLFMGEFGAYEQADMESRIKWTRFVREEAEKRNIAWAYWEFGTNFGVYDRDKSEWKDGLLNALIP